MRGIRRIALLVLLLPAMAAASGPRWVTGPPFFIGQAGVPIGWRQTNLMYYTDPGGLSASVNHQAADVLVAAAAGVWNVPEARISVSRGGLLAEHVSGQNSYLDTSGLVFPDDVMSANAAAVPIAVVYDTDGSVTDVLLGSGASNSSGCRQNAVTQTVDRFDPAGYILHAMIVLNGRCTGAAPELQLEMQYQLVRAFGRVLGLAWSQTNDNVFTGTPIPTHVQAMNWPIMHPLDIICGLYAYQCLPSPFQLRPDDIGSLVAVYPNAQNVVAGPGKQPSLDVANNATGRLYFPTGQGMAGVNVLVRRKPAGGSAFDDFYMASGVSGAGFRSGGRSPFVAADTSAWGSFGTNDPNQSGTYSIAYVPLYSGAPWQNLGISTEPVNPLYVGQHGVGPYALSEVAPSGSAMSQASYGNGPWSEAYVDFTIPDAAPSCGNGADGTPIAPKQAPATGWWRGVLCGYGHASYIATSVRPGRSFTLEVTALDEQGIATESKAMPVIGLFAPTDRAGDLPSLGVTPAAFNSMAVGMTKLSVQTGQSGSVWFGIADERGDGRPDFNYQARLFYADTILPAQTGIAGGRITISGFGFRVGNAVLVNGFAAKVLSRTATTIVATAPAMTVAKASNGSAVDVVVRDLSTGASSTMTGAFTYTSATALPNTMQVVSAPVAPSYVGDAALAAFSVQVLAPDGVTPIVGDSVVFTATTGTALFAPCGAATCTVLTDANGLASTQVTPTSPGTLMLQATDGSLTQAISLVVTVQTGSIRIWSAPSGNVPVGVVAQSQIGLTDLQPNNGGGNPYRLITFSVVNGAATFGGCATATCTVTTDWSGSARIYVTPTAIGPVTIQVADGDVTATASFVAVSNTDVMTIAATPVASTYIGNYSGNFAVNLFQADGVTPDVNQILTFTGPPEVVFDPCGSNVCKASTGWGGVASVNVHATQPGTFTLQAAFSGMFQSVSIAVVPHTLQLNIVSVPANNAVVGVVAAAPFTAQLLQDNTTPLDGVAIALDGSSGQVSLGACSNNAPGCRIFTDANGFVSTTVTPLQAGTITLDFIYPPITTSATFTAVGIGRTMTAIQQPPTTVWVGDTVNFAVQVLAPGGVAPMPGDPVLYSILSGPFGFSDWTSTTVVRQADGSGESFEVGVASAAGLITVLADDGVVSQTFHFIAAARPDVVMIVSAPASGGLAGTQASVPFGVQVMLRDGVTPAVNRTVTISVTHGAASFAACAGAAICQVVTDTQGMVTTLVTPLSSGVITLSASEGGVSQSVSFTAVAPVAPPQLIVTALNSTLYVASGAVISYPLNALILYDGSPAAAQVVQWTLASGFAAAATYTVTNSAGVASNFVWLGQMLPGGKAVATACAWGNVCAEFDGFGVDAATEAIAIVSGAQQSVIAGAALLPVVVMVVDDVGHPVAAAAVSVYQTLTAFDATCPDRGRCPVAAVLASQATVAVSGIDGLVRVVPLALSGRATQTEIAFSVGRQGFATVVETAQP